MLANKDDCKNTDASAAIDRSLVLLARNTQQDEMSTSRQDERLSIIQSVGPGEPLKRSETRCY